MRSLKTLCLLHPDDPTLQIELAEDLSKKGHEVAALVAARKAYQILKNENAADAEHLVQQFGSEVIAECTRPQVSEDYMPLASYFGKIATIRRKVRLQEGETLFRIGEPAKFMYLILDGELAISSVVNERPMLLNYLHKGTIVGEGAMHTGAVRTANVTANKETLLLRLSAEEINSAFSQHPKLQVAFAKEAIIRRSVTVLSSSPAFSRLPMDLRFLIAKRTWSETHEANAPINNYTSLIAMVASGIVHSYENSEGERVYCGRIKAGEIIGLHQLKPDEVFNLEHVAHTRCELIYMDLKVLEDIMDISPWFCQTITDATTSFSTLLQQTVMLHNPISK